MANNNNWGKNTGNNFKKSFNNKKGPRKEENFLDKFKGASVEVRNGDVNGAIRKLKKILENADRQKELAKREFYEKPSAKRKRQKDAAVKRTQREENKKIFSGEAPLQEVSGFAFMKSKRKRRKYSDKKSAVDRHLRTSGLR
jgi:small subunit ribosomal protein S21|tara:strand:- start:804 stop:1229 length:426 start_codon:yes stop_codon:yes gene_type:complete